MLMHLVDFGLVILIWMVQLIVYPGFRHYEEKALINWHHHYTKMITVIVLPLMLSQLILHTYRVYFSFSYTNIITLLLVLTTWLLTFMYAVPKHGNISDGKEVMKSVNDLVKVNWPRTIIWSLIFGLGFIS